MDRLLLLLLGILRSACRGRADLVLENVALQHQLGVLMQADRRPRVTAVDRSIIPGHHSQARPPTTDPTYGHGAATGSPAIASSSISSQRPSWTAPDRSSPLASNRARTLVSCSASMNRSPQRRLERASARARTAAR
jgi:hypothetical protein